MFSVDSKRVATADGQAIQGWLPLALAGPAGALSQRSKLTAGDVLECERDLQFFGAGGEYGATVKLSLPCAGGGAELSCSDGDRSWAHPFDLSRDDGIALKASFLKRHVFTREMIGRALTRFAASEAAHVPSFLLPAMQAAAMEASIYIFRDGATGGDPVGGHVHATYFLEGNRERLLEALALVLEVNEFALLRGRLEPPDGVSIPQVHVRSLVYYGRAAHPHIVRLLAAGATSSTGLRLVLGVVPSPADAVFSGLEPAAASVVSASLHVLGQLPVSPRMSDRRYHGGRLLSFEAPAGTGHLQMCVVFSCAASGNWIWQVRGAHSQDGGLDLARAMDYGKPTPVPVPPALAAAVESTEDGWTDAMVLDLLVRSVRLWRPDPSPGLFEVCATWVLSLPAASITVVAMAFLDGVNVLASSASVEAFEAELSKCAARAGEGAVELSGRWNLYGPGDEVGGDLPGGLFMHSAAGAALLHAALVSGRRVYVELLAEGGAGNQLQKRARLA